MRNNGAAVVLALVALVHGGCGGEDSAPFGTGGQGAAATAGAGGTAGTGGTGGTAGTGGTGGSAGSGGEGGGASVANPYVGVRFWAVDLPNERGFNDVWDEPWAVLLSNVSAQAANVVIEQNDAAPGQPLSLSTFTSLQVPVGQSVEVTLPTREVTGMTGSTPDPPGPPMTWLSSAAFRITSDVPLSVVQVNPADNASSNDGALLVPEASLAAAYLVSGAPTAHPISIGTPLPGVPDHSSVTIVGTQASTTVTVTVGGDVLGDGIAIQPTPAGGTVTATLGPFDVLNLASDAEEQTDTGDLSGTRVVASAPVAVFTSGERITVPWTAGPPPPPGYGGTHCCTEHAEEQLLPEDRYRNEYVIARSPVRSINTYVEPDVLRVFSVSGAADVQTNLPAPFDSFTVPDGAPFDLWTQGHTVLTADVPVIVSQALVSEEFTEGGNGDPALTIVPPPDVHTTRALFYVATGWQTTHLVITTPSGNTLELDDQSLDSSCTDEPLGDLNGTSWRAVTCDAPAGSHELTGTLPFGATLYGYDHVASFAFALGGS